MADPMTAKDVLTVALLVPAIVYGIYVLISAAYHDFFFYGRDEWWKDKLRRLHTLRR